MGRREGGTEWISSYNLTSPHRRLGKMNVEVLEFLISKESKVKGKKIKDIDFPRSAIIGGVIRDGVGKIALGDFVIKKGDRILVCSLYNAINKVEKLFL